MDTAGILSAQRVPRLSIFLHDFSATGVVRNALAVARHMVGSGWAVTVVACRAEGELASEAEGLDQIILRPGPRGGLSRALDLVAGVVPLRRALASLAPDLCLSAGNHAHLPCWLATRGMMRPLRIYRISNDLGHGDTSGPWSPRRLSSRLVVRDAAKLILVSPALGDDPLLGSALVSGKAVVIANGVDVEAARRRAADPRFVLPWQQQGDPVVLAAGRMVKQKNFETLVEAAALANARCPLRLVIIGKGTAAAKARLLAKARECGFSNRLLLPGVNGNPFAAMRHASVVVLSSLWEGSPNVLLEAMAVGTPVVASRTAGNTAAILDDGTYGLLVDPLRSDAMADAIALQLDAGRRVLPGDRAEQFDHRVSLEVYRRLFDDLVPLRSGTG